MSAGPRPRAVSRPVIGGYGTLMAILRVRLALLMLAGGLAWAMVPERAAAVEASLIAQAVAPQPGPPSAAPAAPQTGGREAVFVNRSRITRCAEEDNVDVRVLADDATSLRISAEHPPYIGLIREDSTAPDFTDCDMSSDPVFRFKPRTVILYEDASIRLVGHAFETFWRPEVVDFRVGERNEPGLHLVQLLRKGPPDIEILVVYPSDGYWRAKPLPPKQLPDSAYGSSFLVGPVEDDGRPIVKFRAFRFEPADLSFHLEFANGQRGVLRVLEDSREHTRLGFVIDRAVAPGQAIAALRSMYVTRSNADVSLAIGPVSTAGAQRHEPIMSFERFRAAWGRFGRVHPSWHNLSAPDMLFDQFGTAPLSGGPTR